MKLDSSAFVAELELFEALAKRSSPVNCTDDHVLFRQGEPPQGLYLLRNGYALMTMESPTGDVVMCATAGAGSLLGLPGLIGNVPYSLSAKALKGAEVQFLDKEDFSKLMLSEPALSVKILRVLAAEVRTARQAVTNL
ncbi:MAG: Crp/Fnr family transcriptional regulator [Acidobacteriota bacterium]